MLIVLTSEDLCEASPAVSQLDCFLANVRKCTKHADPYQDFPGRVLYGIYLRRTKRFLLRAIILSKTYGDENEYPPHDHKWAGTARITQRQGGSYRIQR